MSNTYPTYRIPVTTGITFEIASVIVGPGRIKHASGVMLPDSVKLVGAPKVPAGAVLETADGIPIDLHDTLPVYEDAILALLVYANGIDATKPWKEVLVGQDIPVNMAKVAGGVQGFKMGETDDFAVLFLRVDTEGIQDILFPCEDTAEDLLGGIEDLRSLFLKPKKGKGKTSAKPSFNINAKASRADADDGDAPQSGLKKLFG